MAAPFFIYVNGTARPKRPQPDIETARTEALRLFRCHDHQREVLILETCERIVPTRPPGPA